MQPCAGLVVLVVGLGSLGGCGAAEAGRPVAGAQSTAKAGPTVVVTHALPTLLPRVTATAQSTSVPASRLQSLAAQITGALRAPGRVSPHVEVGLRADGGKINVSWVVNTDVHDNEARTGVRDQALKIMTLVKASGIDGSVQLSATGATAPNVNKRVLWARFTRGTMRKTDWAKISTSSILTLCDKPAELEPGFS